MKSAYLTVVINDRPTSVVRTTSHELALSITKWMGMTEIGAASDSLPERKAIDQGHSVICRAASQCEIAVFEENDIAWQGASLVAILL